MARESWRSLTHKTRNKHEYRARPQDWPGVLNNILNGRRDYPSPQVPSQAQAFVAFRWLEHRTNGNAQGRFCAHASWWSRLAPQFSVLQNTTTDEVFVCLFAGRWGCIMARLASVGNGAWAMKPERGAIQVQHIIDHKEWLAIEVTGAFSVNRLVIEQLQGGQSLLQWALRRRRALSAWELYRALDAMEPDSPDGGQPVRAPPRDSLRRLIENVFRGGEPDNGQVREGPRRG